MKKYIVESRKDDTEIFDNYVGDYIESDSSYNKLQEAEIKITEMDKRFQKSIDEIKKLKLELKEANEKIFDCKEIEVFELLLKSALCEYKKKIEQQAQIIVNFATSPDAPSFKEAVRKHRAYTETARSYKYHIDNIRSRM